MNATGELEIKLINDYLFRALLQKNNNVLKGLIASLLHMEFSAIDTVVIENPIELSDSVDGKDFILDIKVTMNDKTIINLEMQVCNFHDWPERSLSYMCRSFDNLGQGMDYINVQPVIQIGLLNYSLFKDEPEFCASYHMRNDRSYSIYSSKLQIIVLDLTHVDLATDEDKLYKVDYWAQLFKANTWEDIKMLAEKSEIISEAAETVYEISQDRLLKDKARARAEYLAQQKRIKEETDRLLAENAKQSSVIAEDKKLIAEQEKRIAELEEQLKVLQEMTKQ